MVIKSQHESNYAGVLVCEDPRVMWANDSELGVTGLGLLSWFWRLIVV